MFFGALMLLSLAAVPAGAHAQTAQEVPHKGHVRADAREKRAALREALQGQRAAQRPPVREMSPRERAELRQQLRQQRRHTTPPLPPPS